VSEQGTIGDGPNGFGSDVARDDWQRYGGAGHQGGPSGASPAQAHGETDDLGRLRDELYLDYRRESSGPRRRTPEQEAARLRRRTANIVGLAAAAAVVGAAALVFNIQASTFAVTTPSPFVRATPMSVASAGPSGSFVAPSQAPVVAQVGVTIQMPLTVTIPDRGLDPDDGTTMYLTGNTGGFAVDPGTGRVLRVFPGDAFAGGMRRAVVDQSLWLSTWPSNTAVCGPACWADATTYQLDLSTGKVLAALDRSYLVGATSGGVWVATGSNVERLDPRTAAVVATTPWTPITEPRVGCDDLWSYAVSATTSRVDLVDPATGAPIGGSSLSADYTFGPINSDGQCWMMTGSGGSSKGATKLAWLNPDGSTYAERSYNQSLVVLDHEFWVYSPDGTMQRFEAASGNPYGLRYRLPATPADGDPRWFFASTGTLWLIHGATLVGFDIDTGASAVRL
jgi:hypothetical protein